MNETISILFKGVWLNILHTISKLGVITNGLIIAFTSEFIPRLVYSLYYSPTGTLDGYVNHTLTEKSSKDFSQPHNFTICSYREFREPFDSPNKFSITIPYYHILAARLIFFLIFEVNNLSSFFLINLQIYYVSCQS